MVKKNYVTNVSKQLDDLNYIQKYKGVGINQSLLILITKIIFINVLWVFVQANVKFNDTLKGKVK